MKKQQKLVYLVRTFHNGEFSFAIQSFTDSKWICELSVSCPVGWKGENKNKLLRDFGADTRKALVKKDQELLFGEQIPILYAASFGKALRQFTPLSAAERSFFFEGFSI